MIMAIADTSVEFPVFYCDTPMGGRSKVKININALTLDGGIHQYRSCISYCNKKILIVPVFEEFILDFLWPFPFKAVQSF